MSVDVLALVEAHTAGAHPDPVPLRELLGPGWSVRQNRKDGQRAGSALAVRSRGPVKITRSRLRLLSTPAPDLGYRFIRSSLIRVAGEDQGRATAVLHFPLPKTGKQQEAMREVRRWVIEQRRAGRPWKVDGDVNMDPAKFARLIGAHDFVGTDVMVSAWSRWWGDYTVETMRKDTIPGTDHGALFVTFTDLRGRPTFCTANMAFPNPNDARLLDHLTGGPVVYRDHLADL